MDCPHLVTRLVYDEYVCWVCGASLTYPPRAPAPDEKRPARSQQAIDGHRLAAPKPKPVAVIPGTISCLACHREQLPRQVDMAGRVLCQKCRIPLALQCACCLEKLARIRLLPQWQ